ncbi:pyruvate dehydrogenase complex dihydrolipoamide acetyltransferase [Oscillatoria amoena NRMC-F 0135]|nr:pyruvate dehydrogenase complex dihydrolipoamide acetyltransferase [Oscillatoria amoena NRMC-F 0135]
MAEVIRMPKMSDTMTEGVIVEWLKKVGDTVKSGDILAEVETDKATMELENYVKGTLLHIGIQKGQAVPVDGIIAIVGEPGEDIAALLAGGAPAAKTEAPKEEAKAEAPAVVTNNTAAPVAQPVVTSNDDSRLKASPLARKMAEERGIDIQRIHGSGDNGRIVKRDVENYKESAASVPAAAAYTGVESFSEEPVSQMRKTIARRLAESKFTAPHFYLTMEINMDKAVEARTAMNSYSPVKLSYNDMVIKAAAIALRQHPQVNSSWMGEKIRHNSHIHVGVAVAVDEGLLVPVVRFADNKSLSQISAEVKELADKAKNKKLQPAEWEGNTFSISNLGMYGIEEFTAIINPPNACILAVGSMKETVIVENGQMRPGHVMKVTLSCDHRVVDGVVGSKFLQTFKNLLEEPVRLLV